MHPRTAFFALSLPLLSLAIANSATAQWVPDGVRVTAPGVPGDIGRVVADGSGGVYIAWRDLRNNSDVYVQHLTASGLVAPGWPFGGLPLATSSAPQNLTDLAPDGLGGALVLWEDLEPDPETARDPVVQRVLADGSFAPGWPANGVRIRTPGSMYGPVVAPDGTGGAYVAWNNGNVSPVAYAQHITSNGEVAPNWPVSGRPLNGLPIISSSALVLPDGSGGAFFTWTDSRTGTSKLYGSRIQYDNTLAPGWAPGGNFLFDLGTHGLVADGAGGFYIVASTVSSSPGFQASYVVQRFTSSSTVAPGWPTNGVLVCNAPGSRALTSFSSDGLGGVQMCWYDLRPPYDQAGGEIFAARVLPNGTLAAGWPFDGLLVSDPNNGEQELYPYIAPDGLGGAYLVWAQDFPSIVQHLTAGGVAAPGWPPFGRRLASSVGQDDGRIASDGQGGAVVVWHEGCCGRIGLWAQRFVMDGIVATELSLVNATAEPDRVRLEWYGAQAANLEATLYRREGSTDWREIERLVADGTGYLKYEDRDVTAGAQYGYRLGYLDESGTRFTAETRVEVPATRALSLEGFRPNPAVATPLISFTLPGRERGSLELFDLAGRRVASRDLGSLAPGRHVLGLEGASALPAGAYIMRLTHGDRRLVARGVVVR